jgi:hypothetical protein
MRKPTPGRLATRLVGPQGRRCFPDQCHVTLAEFAEGFKRILRAHGGAGGRTTVPKHKGTRQNVR